MLVRFLSKFFIGLFIIFLLFFTYSYFDYLLNNALSLRDYIALTFIVFSIVEYMYLLKRIDTDTFKEKFSNLSIYNLVDKTFNDNVREFAFYKKAYAFIFLFLINLFFYLTLLFLVNFYITLTTSNEYKAHVDEVLTTKSYDSNHQYYSTLYAPKVSFYVDDKKVIKESNIYTSEKVEVGDSVNVFYSKYTDDFLVKGDSFYIQQVLTLFMAFILFYFFTAFASYAFFGQISFFIIRHIIFLRDHIVPYLLVIMMFVFTGGLIYIIGAYFLTDDFNEIPFIGVIFLIIFAIIFIFSSIFTFIHIVLKKDLPINRQKIKEQDDEDIEALLQDFNEKEKEKSSDSKKFNSVLNEVKNKKNKDK